MTAKLKSGKPLKRLRAPLLGHVNPIINYGAKNQSEGHAPGEMNLAGGCRKPGGTGWDQWKDELMRQRKKHEKPK
jgi:hypothetical protein